LRDANRESRILRGIYDCWSSRSICIASVIGTLNEGPLHAALRARRLQPGDEVEIALDGYVVDIRRGDLVIEVQTANFSRMARKMRELVSRHKVRLIYPIPRELWILKPAA